MKTEPLTTEEVEMPKLLTPDEVKRLKFCEEQIAAKVNAFMDVGAALLTIRDQRLYRVNFSTFEKYCVAKFGFSDRRARQYIDAFQVVFKLSEEAAKTGTIVPLPKNEAQAREISEAAPETRLEVLKEASEKSSTGEPTAKEIRETIENRNNCSGSNSMPLAIRKFDVMQGLEKLDAKVQDLVARFPGDLETIVVHLEGRAEELRELYNKSDEKRAKDAALHECEENRKKFPPKAECPFKQSQSQAA